LHLDFDFVKQLFQLSRNNELGNVVVGVELFASRQQALPNFDGNRIPSSASVEVMVLRVFINMQEY
jgi:hypothetical protein